MDHGYTQVVLQNWGYHSLFSWDNYYYDPNPNDFGQEIQTIQSFKIQPQQFDIFRVMEMLVFAPLREEILFRVGLFSGFYIRYTHIHAYTHIHIYIRHLLFLLFFKILFRHMNDELIRNYKSLS